MLFSICLIFCKIQLGVAYKSVAYNDKSMQHDKVSVWQLVATTHLLGKNWEMTWQLEKRPYSEFLRSMFCYIWSEYREIFRIFPYSVQMRENTDQKNSKHGHFPLQWVIQITEANFSGASSSFKNFLNRLIGVSV